VSYISNFFIQMSVVLCMATSNAITQTFPIVPVSDPAYPRDIQDFEDFQWDEHLDAVLQRLGDINNDGLDDIVVIFARASSQTLNNERAPWVFLQNQQGTFDQPTPFNYTIDGDFDGSIYDFSIHDHNNDGLNDLIIATDETTIPMLATPKGFVAGQQILASEGMYGAPRILYIDTDLDGDEDLVRWTPDGFAIEIWHNEGNGVYARALDLERDIFVDDDEVRDLRFSDFDGDNDLDILIIAESDLYWSQQTNLGYEPFTQWSIEPTNFDVGRVAGFVDVNADGLVDVVVNGDIGINVNGYGFYLAPFVEQETREIPIYIFPEINNSSNWPVRAGWGWANVFHSPGDLDGDGIDDVIIKPFEDSNRAFMVTDFLNQNGRFGVSRLPDIHGDGLIEPEQYPHSEYNNSDVYLDVNNDGALDRIVLTSAYRDAPIDPKSNFLTKNQGVMLWATLGNPFSPDVFLNAQDGIASRSNYHLNHADLDGDNKPEIIRSSLTHLRVIRRKPDGLWEYPTNISFAGDGTGFRTVVTQLDTDERVDIISLDARRSMVIPSIFPNVQLPEIGQELIQRNQNEVVDYNQMLADIGLSLFSTVGSSFAVGDVDSDGDIDMLIRGDLLIVDQHNESVLVWLNDGDGNFTPGPLSQVQAYENRTNTVALIDHDHDGVLELVSIQGPAEDGFPIIAIYENDGDGRFTQDIEIPTQNHRTPGIEQYWIKISDLDQDGYEDIQILLRAPLNSDGESDIVILYGSPSGISAAPVYIAGNGGLEVHSADLDANGLLDLFTCSASVTREQTSSITIMFQAAPREFLPSISINDYQFSAVDALDMNSDGVLDLIGGGSGGAGATPDDDRVFLSIPNPCRADLDLSKTVDFYDISLFLELFSDQRPLADFNKDGLYDFFDISEFLDFYSEGCP
tara:strand:- start:95947 stop:98679 length:2733 start_codon:yes stop_codon:yes gene_type:complete